MFGSTVLEIALGLCVFYIALSLVCSGVTQYFSEWRSRRGRILVDILGELVNHRDPDGARFLHEILSDARIAGGKVLGKPRVIEKGTGGSPGSQGFLLPAGGRISPEVFTSTILDVFGRRVEYLLKVESATAPSGQLVDLASVAGAASRDATGSATTSPDVTTSVLVQRLIAAITSIQRSGLMALSGLDLAKWEQILRDARSQVDLLAGKPLKEAAQRAETILNELKRAADAESQIDAKLHLIRVIGSETDEVLGLARRLASAQALRLVAQGLPETSALRTFLLRLASRGAIDPDEVKEAIQGWYDSVNQRVSVEYRGKTQRILFITGLGVSLMLNADSISMVNRLAQDQALRKAVTDVASSLAQEPLHGQILAPAPARPLGWERILTPARLPPQSPRPLLASHPTCAGSLRHSTCRSGGVSLTGTASAG